MINIIQWIKAFYCGYQSILMQYVLPLVKQKYGKLGINSFVKNNSTIVQQNIYADDFVLIQDQINFISYHGKLIVGKYSVISSGCTIVPGSHRFTVGVPFYLSTMKHINDDEGNIVIEEDCWIGSGCILLPKCHIGRGAVVGAGSVVKKDVPPYAVVAGVPARIIASKFTIEQILQHEAILYPPKDRYSRNELEILFKDKFQSIKSIGVDSLSNEDKRILESSRFLYGIKDYSLLNE